MAILPAQPPISFAHYSLVENIIFLLGMKAEWVRNQGKSRRHFKVLPSFTAVRCTVVRFILGQDKSLIEVNEDNTSD